MVVCVPQADVDNTLAVLAGSGEQAFVIGNIEKTGAVTEPHVEFTHL
jgi:phosphoribosylaminoimidazole (AIR) synthetase